MKKVTVSPGKTADVSLSLEHGGAIEGNVHYANGQPAYQEASGGTPAGVHGLSLASAAPTAQSPAPRPARTDAQGHFRIPDVPAGSYLVLVPLSASTQGSAANRTPDAKSAVVRGTGTTSGIDITLPTPGPTP